MRKAQIVQLPVKLLAGLGLAVFFAGNSIGAELLFIGGGYAELCSNAAFNIEHPGRVEITGSRLGLGPIELCNRAIENQDGTTYDLAASYNNRGVLFYSQNNFDQALMDFEEAIGLKPELAQAHINRGYTLIALKRWSDSIAALTRGIELGSSQTDKAYFNRGLANEEAGHVREAYFDYQKAAELNPEWEAPQLELARFSVVRKK